MNSKHKLIGCLCYFAFAKALLSCTTSSKLEQEIAQIPVEVSLVKFHEEFSNSTPDDLESLKTKYPQLLSGRVSDSIWTSQLADQDTILNALENAVKKADFNYDIIETELKDVMRHVKYYFPEFEPTPIVTLISEVNYRKQVIPTHDKLLVSIDTYLGEDHDFYKGINAYQRTGLNRSSLSADAALAYAQLFVQPSRERSLLGQMVYHGKLHYLQELFAPASTPADRFNYTAVKYDFTVANESEMWRYLIDDELLYKTDARLLSRFILPAPFSKFYLEIDSKTPGGIGRYLGYRMVSSFMDSHPETTLDAMINLPGETLFQQSNYKPKQ